jgi:hypothetical protein
MVTTRGQEGVVKRKPHMIRAHISIPYNVRYYLRGVEFPAAPEVVAETVERNGDPLMAYKIRNSGPWRFDSPEEVWQAVRSGPHLCCNRAIYHNSGPAPD